MSFCFGREVRVSQSVCCSFRYLHSLVLRRYPRCRAEVTFDSEKPVIGVPGEAGAVQPVKDRWE
jgi:hypothetical protein